MGRNRGRKKNKKRKSSNAKLSQAVAIESSDENTSTDNKLDDELVSIIMTAYNSENTLEKAITSILKQTYTNFELIIIDDCSTDSTLEVAKRFISDKVRVFRSSINSGTYFCKNYGIKKSKGRYLTFHDADDWCDPNHIEVLHKSYWELKDKNYWSGHRDQDRPTNRIKIVYAAAKIWEDVDGEVKLVAPGTGGITASFGIYKGQTCYNRATITSFFEASLLQDFGFFDSVRFGADSEFEERVAIFYGLQEVKLPNCRNTYNRYNRANSLTRNKDTGLRSHARESYKAGYRKWHRDMVKVRTVLRPDLNYLVGPYMDYPLLKRKFFIPEATDCLVPDTSSEDCFEEIFKD